VLKDLESIEKEEKKEMEKIEKIRNTINTKINSLTSENDLTTISKIAEVGGGKRVPKGFRPLSSKTDYPYIRVTDFEDGTVSLANLKYLNEATFKKIDTYTINDDDVYISIAGTIGLVGIVPPELNGKSLTENAAKITILDRTANDYRFLYYVMASKFVQAQIIEATKKVGTPKLALKRIRSIKIPKVEFGVQQKIATIFRESELQIAQIEKRLAELSGNKVQALTKHLAKN
jgi:type I restriction enzyme S subunit